jgi:hypothetical protein
MIQKQLQHKKNTTRLCQERETNKNKFRKSKQNHNNFQLNLKKMAQAPYVNALQTKQSDASIQFYDANHL